MGYRIIYSEKEQIEKHRAALGHCGILTLLFFVVFLAALKLYWPEGDAFLYNVFQSSVVGTVFGQVEAVISDMH